jgi:hypothetical protein
MAPVHDAGGWAAGVGAAENHPAAGRTSPRARGAHSDGDDDVCRSGYTREICPVRQLLACCERMPKPVRNRRTTSLLAAVDSSPAPAEQLASVVTKRYSSGTVFADSRLPALTGSGETEVDWRPCGQSGHASAAADDFIYTIVATDVPWRVTGREDRYARVLNSLATATT